jgi:hypothetical protein
MNLPGLTHLHIDVICSHGIDFAVQDTVLAGFFPRLTHLYLTLRIYEAGPLSPQTSNLASHRRNPERGPQQRLPMLDSLPIYFSKFPAFTTCGMPQLDHLHIFIYDTADWPEGWLEQFSHATRMSFEHATLDYVVEEVSATFNVCDI